MENLFSAYVETPIGHLRKRWLNEGQRPELDEWATQRALLLLLNLQSAKYAELKFGRSGGLEFMRGGEHSVDTAAARLHDQHQIITSVLPPHLGLLVPETGFFTFFVPDRGCATGHTLAVGMALHARIAVALVSKSVTEEDIQQYARKHENMATLSAGTAPRVRRVLLPPGAEYGNAQVFADRVRSMIERNRKLLQETQAVRRLAAKMWERAGFTMREREVGEKPSIVLHRR